MKILKQDCKKDEAQDKTLPYTCYLIIYKVDGVEKYDLAMASKQVDLFDYYYDLYKENFVSMMQAEGRVAPNMWICLLYTSPSPRDYAASRMPSSA